MYKDRACEYLRGETMQTVLAAEGDGGAIEGRRLARRRGMNEWPLLLQHEIMGARALLPSANQQ